MLLDLCYFLSFLEPGKAGGSPGPRTQNPKNKVTRLLTELSMFEKVTVTDAMAEDIEKLRPRLKKVHIRELVLAMAITPKTHKPIFTCRRKRHCSYNHHGHDLEQMDGWGILSSLLKGYAHLDCQREAAEPACRKRVGFFQVDLKFLVAE